MGLIIGDWKMSDDDFRERVKQDLIKNKVIKDKEVTEEQIAAVRIFAYYQSENFFVDDNQILDNLSVIENIPTILVHGRFDVLCPPSGAWELNKALKNSKLVILASTAHRFMGEAEVARKYAYESFLKDLG